MIRLLALWTVPAVIGTVTLVRARPDAELVPLVLVQLATWWPWAPVTRLVTLLRRRRPVRDVRSLRWLPLHLAAGLGVAAGMAAIAIGIELLTGGGPGGEAGAAPAGVPLRVWVARSLPVFAIAAVVHALVVAGEALMATLRRAREHERALGALERELADARLAALRAQLRPHVIFNTLNGINAYVEADPARARKMVNGLALLLRRALDQESAARVPLAHELELVNAYLDVARLRFEDRMRVRLDVPPGITSLLVPPLVLQPLVENAVLHAVGPATRTITVEVVARPEGDRLVLEVRDDGDGEIDDLPGGVTSTTGHGTGLRNLRERLALLEGDAARLTLTSRPDGGVVAGVSLPLRGAEVDAAVDAAGTEPIPDTADATGTGR